MNISQQLRTPLLVAFSLLAFAGNSVLCRLALGQDNIDAASFTIMRLLSGAGVMVLIVWLQGCLLSNQPSNEPSNHSMRSLVNPRRWQAPLMLFVYAVGFSFAYVSLDTGVGALLLFASVQLTMIVVGFIGGQRPSLRELLGIGLAFVGLLTLLLPGASAPPLMGSVLMTISGVAWGIYTLLGRGSKQPIIDTGINFINTLPWAGVLLLVSWPLLQWTWNGGMLAVCSGALTSAVGYSLWYAVLPRLSITQAAVLQLLVPIIAALGGVLFAAESLSGRLVVAGLLVLGGILMVIFSRYQSSR